MLLVDKGGKTQGDVFECCFLMRVHMEPLLLSSDLPG